jgi:putative NADH-flavin reductase
MRIALLGGSGRIGSEVLDMLLADDHEVQVLARSGGSVRPADGLTVTEGDALDPASVAAVVKGADAVVSALGPRGARSQGLLEGAAANTVAAMNDVGVRRLIAVSAAGAFIMADPDSGALTKFVVPRVFAKPFADVRRMEDVIRASGLEWTLVRPTRLVRGPATSQYRTRSDFPPQGGMKVSRADVAQFIVDALGQHSWIGASPALAY